MRNPPARRGGLHPPHPLFAIRGSQVQRTNLRTPDGLGLCHLDNPEKAQYEVQDVECLGGADYLDKVKSAVDTDTAVAEMMDWCMDQGCYSFFRLSNYARQNRSDWFRVITTSRTVFLTAWLKSMEWEVRNGNPVE